MKKNYWAYGYIFDNHIEFIDSETIYESYEDCYLAAESYLKDNLEFDDMVVIMKVKPFEMLSQTIQIVSEEIKEF